MVFGPVPDLGFALIVNDFLGVFRDSNSQLLGDYSIYLLGINFHLGVVRHHGETSGPLLGALQYVLQERSLWATQCCRAGSVRGISSPT